MVNEEVPGEKRLLAYIKGTADATLVVDELRTHLRRELPDYMIPNAFVVMEKWPLTPNGKVDRKALPAPDLGAYGVREYQRPQGAIEERLAALWRDLLRLERVGRHDNFFDIGGHSLLASRVIAHISHEMGVDIPLRALFNDPTIEGLGRYIVREETLESLMKAS